MVSQVATFIIVFLLTVLPGGFAVEWLRKLGAKQTINSDAPSTHAKKQGTPTMGGLLFLFPFVLVTLVIALASKDRFQTNALIPLLVVTIAHALIGFADDYLSAKRGKNLGLRAREKFAAQVLVAIGFVVWLAKTSSGHQTIIQILPAGTDFSFVDLGWAYYPLAVLMIVGFSNATNFSDGLDGLAGGLTMMIALALTLLFSASIYPSLCLYTAAFAGGLAGFLWWNAHPAKMFMGDTGSLPIGAGLAAVALVGKMEIAFIIASALCWAELISVIIQVSVFKIRKRQKGIEYARANRIFRRTPLHHHFEEVGIPETTIVWRFWIAGLVCAALALLWGRA